LGNVGETRSGKTTAGVASDRDSTTGTQFSQALRAVADELVTPDAVATRGAGCSTGLGEKCPQTGQLHL